MLCHKILLWVVLLVCSYVEEVSFMLRICGETKADAAEATSNRHDNMEDPGKVRRLIVLLS